MKAARVRSRIAARDHGDHPPLSLAQQRVWFYDVLAPDAPFHCVPRVLKVNGPLDVAILERALNRIVERHDVLRSVYQEVDGSPQQTIVPSQRLTVPVRDLAGRSADKDGELDGLIRADIAAPFDISEGPLVRLSAYRLAAEDWRLVLNFHHIACDGWSERISLNELTALYAAYKDRLPDPLPPLKIQYADYAAWENALLNSDGVRQHHEYWRRQLGREIPVLDLPADFPRPPSDTYEGDSVGLEVPSTVVDRLRDLAVANRVTLFMVAIAAYATLLMRYTGQEDIVIGSPINNREFSDVHDLIGYFVTRLPLRFSFEGDPSFTELLDRVRATVLDAIEHKVTTAAPWPYPRDELGVQGSSHYRLIFFFQENPVGAERRFADLELTNANIHSQEKIDLMGIRSPTVSVQLDLGFFLEPVGDRLFGWIEYSSALFTRQRILRMREHFLTLLSSIVADQVAPVSRLPILSDAERKTLVAPLSAAGRAALSENLLVHRLWEKTAETSPDVAAVTTADGQSLSYGELDQRANAVAQALRDRGVGPGDTVAVLLPRSPDLIAAVLGTLKAGAACAPLDDRSPGNTLSRRLEHLAPAVVLGSDGGKAERYEFLAPPERGVASPVDCDAGPSDAAFVFSTSGSTGNPRAVRISHRAAAAGQLPDLTPFRLGPRDRLLMTTSPGSVRLIGEIFWAAAAGACIVIPDPHAVLGPAELADTVRRHEVTVMASVPSALKALIEGLAPGDCASLRLLLTLGEPLPQALGAHVRFVLPQVTLVNSYAQTEACPALFWEYESRSSGAYAPVGSPGPASTAYVLDQNLEPVPVGIDGEIYIGGLTVADGYHRDDEETSKRFVPDPYAGTADAVMFKTGDRGRLLAPGLFAFIGRIDDRIKVRGHSVEPGAIEAELCKLEGITAAAVVAPEESRLSDHLMAYVVHSAGTALDTDALHSRLAAVLPEYMLPRTIVAVPDLPRTTTGKLDRKAVRVREPLASANGAATETQGLVHAVWEEVLGVQVAPEDSFYDLGGNSLEAVRIVSRLSKAIGRKLPVSFLFEARTVVGLAQRIEALGREAAR